jgi:D-alanine-D-alanine ligase-like ATP-grasp enzyme
MYTALLYGARKGEHKISLLSESSLVRNIDITNNTIILIKISKQAQYFF